MMQAFVIRVTSTDAFKKLSALPQKSIRMRQNQTAIPNIRLEKILQKDKGLLVLH